MHVFDRFRDENPLESTNPQFLNVPTLEGYQYPVDDMVLLHDLLTNWGLGFLFQILLGEYQVSITFLCIT